MMRRLTPRALCTRGALPALAAQHRAVRFASKQAVQHIDVDNTRGPLPVNDGPAVDTKAPPDERSMHIRCCRRAVGEQAELLKYTFNAREGQDPFQRPVNYLTDPESKDQLWLRCDGTTWFLSRVAGGRGEHQLLSKGGRLSQVVVSIPKRVPLTLAGKVRNFCAHVGAWHRNSERTELRHRILYDDAHHVPVGQADALAAMQRGTRIFAITGHAGAGKTAFAEETVPRALREFLHRRDGDGGVVPVFHCITIAQNATGNGPDDWIRALKDEFRFLLSTAMDDPSYTFSLDEAVQEQQHFGLAYAVIDEARVDSGPAPPDLEELYAKFKKATPWAKEHFLAVAGTALSHHPGLPASNVETRLVKKVRLRWNDSHVVDLVGKVARDKAAKKKVPYVSDEAAVRVFAQLLLGVMPAFVPQDQRPSVQRLLDDRRCANLGYLMRHNARACRLVADALVPGAVMLTRQLLHFDNDCECPIDLERSAGRNGIATAQAVTEATGLSVAQFVQHYLDELSNKASVVVMDCVLQLFTFNGVSNVSKPRLIAVSEAILAVVNKERCVTTTAEWVAFQEQYPGAVNAVSYGFMTLDLEPHPETTQESAIVVSLEPTVVGLYIALTFLGFVVPNVTSHEGFFQQVAAMAVVTKFHLPDVIADGVHQCSFESLEASPTAVKKSRPHFDGCEEFPVNSLVFPHQGSQSSGARFRDILMQMKVRSADETTECHLELQEELTKALTDAPGARKMVFVCEHDTVLLSSAGVAVRLDAARREKFVNLSTAQEFPSGRIAGLVSAEVDVFVMYGSHLQHWWPLLGRVGQSNVDGEPEQAGSTGEAA